MLVKHTIMTKQQKSPNEIFFSICRLKCHTPFLYSIDSFGFSNQLDVLLPTVVMIVGQLMVVLMVLMLAMIVTLPPDQNLYLTLRLAMKALNDSLLAVQPLVLQLFDACKKNWSGGEKEKKRGREEKIKRKLEN